MKLVLETEDVQEAMNRGGIASVRVKAFWKDTEGNLLVLATGDVSLEYVEGIAGNLIRRLRV